MVMGTNTASIMYADNQYMQNPFLKFRINKTPQSTTWVKKEAEAEAKKSSNKGVYQALTLVPPASLSICTSTTLTTSFSLSIRFFCRRYRPLEEASPILDDKRGLHQEHKQGQRRVRTHPRVTPTRPPAGEAAQLQRLAAPIL